MATFTSDSGNCLVSGKTTIVTRGAVTAKTAPRLVLQDAGQQPAPASGGPLSLVRRRIHNFDFGKDTETAFVESSSLSNSRLCPTLPQPGPH